MNKHSKYEENVKNAVDMALHKYGSIIIGHDYRVDEEISSYMNFGDMNIYKFEIDIELSNGNKFTLFDGFDEDLWIGNYLETNTIYKSLERAIEDRITLEYEELFCSDWESGWREDKLGSVSISDIVDRLEGRKVKIMVVD